MPGRLDVWSRWVNVSEGKSRPGARVTAVLWGNQFALFLADPGGGIFTAAGDPLRLFGPWASVSEGQSTPGGSVTAVPWKNRIALFLADPRGGIFTAAGDPQAGFGPWASVSEGQSTPGAPVTAVPWGNRIALFIADPSGGIKSGIIVSTQGDPAQPIGAPHTDAPQEILEIQFENPAPPPSDTPWASSGGKKYPVDEAFEWRQVLGDPIEEYDIHPVGASGWVKNPDNSGADVPFDHPFGSPTEQFPYGRLDWEFAVKLDDKYTTSLLSPANSDPMVNPDERGFFGAEWERVLIPVSFRSQVSDGDRLALFGRWILDTGHSYGGNYRTEIHPPLLMATGSLQQDASATAGQSTRVLFMSRPYLVGQTYALDPKDAYDDTVKDDGPLPVHAKREFKKVGEFLSTQVEAHSKIKSFPFKGTHSLHVVVRPPALQSIRPVQLVVSFQFTIRSGCKVQVSSTAKDSVDVLITLSDDGYTPFPLPKRTERIYFPADLDQLVPGEQAGENLVNDVEKKSHHAAQNLKSKGIKTSEYAQLPEVDILDRGNAASNIIADQIPLGVGVTVNDKQPYPVYGWFEAKWVLALPKPSVTG